MLNSLKFFDNFKTRSEATLTESSLPFFIISSCYKFRKVAFFLKNNSQILELKKKIHQIDKTLKVLILSDFDCSFFSNLSPSNDILLERISTLFKVLNNDKENIIFLSSYKSLIFKIPNIEELIKRKLLISVKHIKEGNYDEILNFLKENNYEKVDFVRNRGEYSIRGNIMDIFSPYEKYPLRILFDLGSIENLSFFDPLEQVTQKQINEYFLIPPSEIIFNEKNITFFRKTFRKLDIKDKNEYYKAISDKIIIPGSGQFLPILRENFVSIFEYLNGFKIFFKNNLENYFDHILDEIKLESSYYQKLIDLNNNFIFTKKNFNELLFNLSYFSINFDQFFKKDKPFFSKNLLMKNNKEANLNNLIISFKKNIFSEIKIICCESKIFKSKLENIFKNNSISYLNIDDLKNFKNYENKAYLIELELDESFIIKTDKFNFIFYSQKDLFKKVIKRETLREVSSDNLINEFSELSLGDFIVHINHGIGKYIGLRKQNVNNIEQDFLEILYDKNDKLLIPVENLDLISKYGQNTQNVSLDKLGIQNWQLRKASIKKKIKDIANELALTAAKRELKKGDYIESKTLEYEKFSSEFEFTETSDQLKTISQIELDLSSGKPMDRLVCGDVGFGKTEIAMRATFLAVNAGFQVALICPKLLLVNQHYETFKKRFSKFEYRIEKISRFETFSKKKKIKENILSGFTNILIGTHAILSSDINFLNLGLIIIDEEQSFGVEQKEKLKKLKPNCHILTLSATPIPRTLQSSILNIKDISLIKTPPVDRLNVKTFLTLYDQDFLKKIIDFELNRQGQIFYVVPRISDLENVKKKLINIVENSKFEILHGRLKTSEIERIYENFFNKRTKILVSTAMIESGLDITNVNTIIIEKPFYFGLSQLYQLRGRVGRSAIQAYAYMFLDKSDALKTESIKKLEIISNIKSLGAGFSIAANDLDMRGAGNIIGSEQSGHIREVGVELYYKMINEAINEIVENKKTISEDDWSPVINLGFSINIPSYYIKNLDHRLSIYRKISMVENHNDLNKIFSNLEDRYGKIPESLKNFFKIIEIKIEAKKLNIRKIDLGIKGCIFTMKKNNVKNLDNIINLATTSPNNVKIAPDHKLIFFPKKGNKMERINDIISFMKLINKSN